MITSISVLIFFTVFFLLIFTTGSSRNRKSEISERIARSLLNPKAKSHGQLKLERRERLSHIPLIDRILSSFQRAKIVQTWIRQSGLNFSTGTFFLISLFIGLLILLWCETLKFPLPASLAASAVGMIVPSVFVKMKRNKRIKTFSMGFADAIARLGTSLRAGYSLQMAIEAMTEESGSLIADEFRIVLAEMEVGQSFETALQKMLNRIDTPDLRLFITSVTIQRESGGNLAEILDNLESTIRERFALQRELEAATSQAKLSGIVLSFLPLFVGLFVFFIHRNYILFFFHDPIGIKLFWCSAIGQLMGVMTIKKIVSIQL